MTHLKTWSTDGLSPHQRVEYWNDCAVQALAMPISVDAVEPRDFWGKISRICLTNVDIAEVQSGAAVVRHSARHAARTAQGWFQLLMQLAGHSSYRQGGRAANLSPGDFTLVDCSRPYELTFGADVANLVVTVHRENLKALIGCPDSLAAVKLSGASGPSGLASRFFRELWRDPQSIIAGSLSPFLERAILDMLAIAYSPIPQNSVVATPYVMSRRVTVLRHIEQHLTDPQLDARTIAAALRVTPRCIYRLFEDDEETLAKYIQRRRLEEAARALTNPTQPHRAISSIAYDHAFASLAHFSRVFREFYGSCPSDYRQAARNSAGLESAMRSTAQ